MITAIRSSLVGMLTEVILESISLPDISLYTLLLLRATLAMAGVSRWLDSLAAAESLLAVLTTLGGHCSLQMDHRMVVAPLYFSLGEEDMVDLVDPVTGLLGLDSLSINLPLYLLNNLPSLPFTHKPTKNQSGKPSRK